MNLMIAERVAELLPSADDVAGLEGVELDRLMWDLEQAGRMIEAATGRCGCSVGSVGSVSGRWASQREVVGDGGHELFAG